MNMILRYGLVLSYRAVPVVRNMTGKYESGSGQDMMVFETLREAIDYMYMLAEDK